MRRKVFIVVLPLPKADANHRSLPGSLSRISVVASWTDCHIGKQAKQDIHGVSGRNLKHGLRSRAQYQYGRRCFGTRTAAGVSAPVRLQVFRYQYGASISVPEFSVWEFAKGHSPVLRENIIPTEIAFG